MKEIDWANLSFGYMKTDYNVRINFRNGAWGELEVSSEEHLNLHMRQPVYIMVRKPLKG